MSEIDSRRLTYADLPQVIAIERRAFPTPWSLAMFVLELSKPSGVCLAAWRGEIPWPGGAACCCLAPWTFPPASPPGR